MTDLTQVVNLASANKKQEIAAGLQLDTELEIESTEDSGLGDEQPSFTSHDLDDSSSKDGSSDAGTPTIDTNNTHEASLRHAAQPTNESTCKDETNDGAPALKRPKVSELPEGFANRLRAINREAAQRHRRMRREQQEEHTKQVQQSSLHSKELLTEEEQLRTTLASLRRQLLQLYQRGGVRDGWQRFPHQPTSRSTLTYPSLSSDLSHWAHPGLNTQLPTLSTSFGSNQAFPDWQQTQTTPQTFSTGQVEAMNSMLQLNLLRVQQAEMQLQMARQLRHNAGGPQYPHAIPSQQRLHDQRWLLAQRQYQAQQQQSELLQQAALLRQQQQKDLFHQATTPQQHDLLKHAFHLTKPAQVTSAVTDYTLPPWTDLMK